MQPPLIHFASPDFWSFYKRLPQEVQRKADKCFSLLKSDPKHPSLHLKKIGNIWSVRAGYQHRVIGIDAHSEEKGILWIWIGSHNDYENFIKQK